MRHLSNFKSSRSSSGSVGLASHSGGSNASAVGSRRQSPSPSSVSLSLSLPPSSHNQRHHHSEHGPQRSSYSGPNDVVNLSQESHDSHMNSSFEVHSYLSSSSTKMKNGQQRHDQMEAGTQEQATQAVQFVPAYQEAVSAPPTPPRNEQSMMTRSTRSDSVENGRDSRSPKDRTATTSIRTTANTAASSRNSPDRRQYHHNKVLPKSPSCIDRMITGKSGTAAVDETSWDVIADEPSASTSLSNHRNHHGFGTSRSSVNVGNRSAVGVGSGGSTISAPASQYPHHPHRLSSSSKPPHSSSSSSSAVGNRLGGAVTPNIKNESSYNNNVNSTTNNPAKAAAAVAAAEGGKGGTRIARLASLFTSRAVVSKHNKDADGNNSTGSCTSRGKAPSSAVGSESSSGYVGWPGTQDKRGATVIPLESSYEESDTGGTSSGHHQHRLNHVNDYQIQEQDEVEREISKWMSHDDIGQSFDSSSTSTQQEPSQHHSLPPASSCKQSGVRGKNRNILPLVPTSAISGPSVSAAIISQNTVEEDKVHRLLHQQHKSMKLSSSLSPPRLLTSTIKSVDEVYGEDDTLNKNASLSNNINSDDDDLNVITTMTDPWSDTVSDLSTSYSKTSSAYFNPREVQAIRKGRTNQISGVHHNREAAASVLRRIAASSSSSMTEPQPPTEEALALNNRLLPPVRTFNAANATGYRGLLHKTEDVPNLMDGVESDSTSAASSATSARTSSQVGSAALGSANYVRRGRYSRQQQSHLQQQIIPEDSSGMMMDSNVVEDFDSESDVFDGLSNPGPVGTHEKFGGLSSESEEQPGRLGATSRAEMEALTLAMLGGGLTTIQTTAKDFSNRRTASDFDETLSNSDVDQYGNYTIPAFKEMLAAGKNHHDRSLSAQSLSFAKPTISSKQTMDIKIKRSGSVSSGPSAGSRSEDGSTWFTDPYSSSLWGQHGRHDLSQYYIHPDKMKIVVKKFRSISRSLFPRLDYEDLEREEDATKAFALAEMRSRIMEVDIERGLERRGGTTVVDDIVLTPSNKAALRVRDAIIVAKAWRDGATPQDVINTTRLTRRDQRFYVPRFRQTSRQGVAMNDWEEVTWVDDLDISQFRCQSIGPRHLRGAELFTIGDCQSILLKLCNERCNELRDELNKATADQIEAEEVMKAEGETFDGMMTEAEMTYLSSMEVVKIISYKLVLAEKAFALVKDRIEKLVAKYEALLVRFETENDSVVASSIFTYESSYVSDDYSFTAAEEREKEALGRRAQRAELRAELAAREAFLAKQQVQAVRDEKEAELRGLRARLADLQSESSAAIAEREHSVVLARAITANKHHSIGLERTHNRVDEGNANGGQNNRSKIDDIKQRFRDRSAAKQNHGGSHGSGAAKAPSRSQTVGMTSQQYQRNSLYRTVGEEMFNHIDFYERSLKAVEG